MMIGRLLSPRTKVNLALQVLRVDADQAAALLRFATSISTQIPGGDSVLAGCESLPDLILKVISVANNPNSRGVVRELLGAPTTQDFLLTKLASELERHPDGAAVIKLLSRISELPLEGWGDTEHENVVDFVRRGLVPTLQTLLKAEANEVTCLCGSIFEISDFEAELEVVQCRHCQQFVRITLANPS